MGRTSPTRVGLRNAGRGPLFVPSTAANRGSASQLPSLQKTKPQSISTSYVSSGKFDVLDGLVEDKVAWKTPRHGQESIQEVESKGADDIILSKVSVTTSSSPKAESAIPEWRRACPNPERYLNIAGNRAKNGLLRNPDVSSRTLAFTASRISCSFPRTWDQPRMTEAGFLDYHKFHKHEFAVGTIIRGVVHEQDWMDTPKPTPVANSTAVTSGKDHITHGNFGPVYSENRFLIVVNNRPEDHYIAVPVYSHKRNGLAKKTHKDEYVSVADHRYLANCQQQSASAPLVTEFLKDGVDELLPMSVAYTSYPVSRKYGLPVAHQGRLDVESTKRLVAMYLKWVKP